MKLFHLTLYSFQRYIKHEIRKFSVYLHLVTKWKTQPTSYTFSSNSAEANERHCTTVVKASKSLPVSFGRRAKYTDFEHTSVRPTQEQTFLKG